MGETHEGRKDRSVSLCRVTGLVSCPAALYRWPVVARQADWPAVKSECKPAAN